MQNFIIIILFELRAFRLDISIKRIYYCKVKKNVVYFSKRLIDTALKGVTKTFSTIY